MWPNPEFPPDLVTFTKEILNGTLDYFELFFLEWFTLTLAEIGR